MNHKLEYYNSYDRERWQYEALKRQYEAMTRPPKKCPTPYFMFFGERYQQVKQEDDQLTNTQMAIELAKEWNDLDPVLKSVYEARAA